MRGPSGRLATATAVVVGVGVLAVAGRLLPGIPTAGPEAGTSAGGAGRAAVSPVTQGALGVLVPLVVGRTLDQARVATRRAGLSGGAVERGPEAPGAVVVLQDPPAGARVAPGSPVGFRTRTDVWPNGRPRRLRLGPGPATARFLAVAARPTFDPLSLEATMPRDADLEVRTRTRFGRRLLLERSNGPGSCGPAGRGQVACAATFEPLGDEDPGIWTIEVAKRSAAPATVRVTVTFGRP
jgi:PASTA domain